MRLNELESCGLIRAHVVKETPRTVEWMLTDKGEDTIPILMSIIAFGIKWYPEKIFGDSQPRRLEDIYPGLAGISPESGYAT
jgi:DNA-binding HxlR family transcriptional regulator